MKKAIIKKVTKGKRKGEYRFILKAENGEIVATSGTESYTQKHSCIETIKSCFPNFEIVKNKD